MARKKKSGQGPAGATWLDTYCDTVTLLMTFFVLLYSMSSLDSEKIKQLSNAFNQVMAGKSASSILEYNLYDGEVPLVGGESKYEAQTTDQSTSQQTYDEVNEYVQDNQLNDVLSIVQDERGIILQMKDSILFETGEANLKPESKAILDKVSDLIATMPNNIIIEGHTDNVPIKTSQFDSNWELSGTRAIKVLRYFTETKNLSPDRFSASGYGEQKPVTGNSTEEERALNRRVNILIVASNEE